MRNCPPTTKTRIKQIKSEVRIYLKEETAFFEMVDYMLNALANEPHNTPMTCKDLGELTFAICIRKDAIEKLLKANYVICDMFSKYCIPTTQLTERE